MGKFKGCGEPTPPGVVLTETGGVVPFFLTGADPDISGGANQVVDMTTEADDFVASETAQDGSFMICIETDAPIVVELLNGDTFKITQAQATAYLGQWYPAKITKVFKSGTTGTFSVGR